MLKYLAIVLCRLFFKRINISGTPYTGGGAIWAANHSSGIVDPAVMLALAPVKIRPLAKHTLWNMPVMKQFLQLTQAIPVTRLQDIKKDVQVQKEMLEAGNFDQDWRSKSNNEAFQLVSEALLRGDCILIFPEGVSHDDPYIYQFKTGIARMALQALGKATDPNFTVIVQPVVIDYSEKDEFRSELCIHYCEPIAITSTEYSVQDIMTGVRSSMEKGFASFFSWDEKRNWRFIFEMAYGRSPLSSREFRIFVESYRPELDSHPVLLGKLQTMRRMLQAIHVSPLQLVWGDQNHRSKRFFLVILSHGLFFIFVTLPIIVLGSIVWVIPSKVCEKLAKKSTTDRDVRATMKIAHGMWFFPVWAFVTSSIFIYFSGDYLPEISRTIKWLLFLVLTPTFLVLSLILSESINFFPGFIRLTLLRLFFPRGWYELMKEWREICDTTLEKIKKVDIQNKEEKKSEDI